MKFSNTHDALFLYCPAFILNLYTYCNTLLYNCLIKINQIPKVIKLAYLIEFYNSLATKIVLPIKQKKNTRTKC